MQPDATLLADDLPMEWLGGDQADLLPVIGGHGNHSRSLSQIALLLEKLK